MSDDRDSANIRHFVSRSKQPKVLAGGPAAQVASNEGISPVNVFIVFDQGFGSVADQIDDTRFKYMGTSSNVARYEQMHGKQLGHSCMRDSFEY